MKPPSDRAMRAARRAIATYRASGEQCWELQIALAIDRAVAKEREEIAVIVAILCDGDTIFI